MKKRKVGRPRERVSRKPLSREVWRLRRAGRSYGEIAEWLSISRQYAHKIYARVAQERAA